MNTTESLTQPPLSHLAPEASAQGVNPAAATAEVIAEPLPPLEFTNAQKLAFAEHVQYIKDNHDALEMPVLTRKILGARVMAATSVLTPGIVVAGGGFIPTMAEIIVVGAVPTVAALWRGDRKNNPETTNRVGRSTQEFLGERYELFKMPPKDDQSERIVMYYYSATHQRVSNNPSKQHTQLEHLQRMASLAEENGVDEVVILRWMADTVLDEKALAGTVRSTERDFLRERGININAGRTWADAEIVSMPPRFWIELGERKLLQKSDDDMLLLINALHKASPDHPLVRVYKQYGKLPDHRRQAMQRVLQTAMQREFSDSEVVPAMSMRAEARDTTIAYDVAEDGEEIMVGNPLTSTHQLDVRNAALSYDAPTVHESAEALRDPIAAQAEPKDKTLQYPAGISYHDAEGGKVASKAFKDILGISKEDMALLLRNVDSNPRRATRVLLGLLAQQVHYNNTGLDLRELFGLDTKDPVKVVPAYGKSVQDMLFWTGPRMDTYTVEKVETDMITRSILRRVAAGVMCATTLVVGASFTFKAIEQYSGNEQDRARVAIATSQGVSPETIPDQQVQDYIAQKGWLAPLWNKWEGLLSGEDSSTGSSDKKDTLDAVSSSGQSTANNARNERKAQGEWYLTTNGTIATSGYWASKTHSDVSFDAQGVQWMNTNLQAEYSYTPPTSLGNERTYIMAERDLAESDAKGRDFVSIPVLEGTEVAAANIDGKAVVVEVLKDGTYQIARQDIIREGKIQFWLTQSADAPKPRAVYSISSTRDSWGKYDIAEIRKVWNDVIPGFIDATLEEQEALMGQYIKNNFDYRLDPFPASFNPDATDPAEWTHRVLERRQANCKVAATLKAINFLSSDIDVPPVTTPVTGYMNYKGKGDKVLSSREGHMWNANTKGDRKDDTPFRGATAEDTAYLMGQDPQEQSDENGSLLTYGLLAGLTALAGIGITQHQAFSRASRRAQAKRVAKAQSGEPPKVTTNMPDTELGDDLITVREVILTALYDQAKDIHAAVARAKATAIDQEVVKKALYQGHMSGSHAQKAVKSLAKTTTDPEYRRAIRHTQEVMNAVRREIRKRPELAKVAFSEHDLSAILLADGNS